MNTFTSSVFRTETMTVPGGTETIVRGGRDLFPLLPQALPGCGGSACSAGGRRAGAQALNLRDSLAGTDIPCRVGLRPGSASADDAREHGFTEEDGTLGDWLAVAAGCDLVILLIADAALAAHHRRSSRC